MDIKFFRATGPIHFVASEWETLQLPIGRVKAVAHLVRVLDPAGPDDIGMEPNFQLTKYLIPEAPTLPLKNNSVYGGFGPGFWIVNRDYASEIGDDFENSTWFIVRVLKPFDVKVGEIFGAARIYTAMTGNVQQLT